MNSTSMRDVASRRPHNVLLAEDDDDLRSLLARTLRDEGYDVTECHNGLSLVEALVSRLDDGERAFDLLVSDVWMPGVSGLSVLEELAGWEALRSLPVVLITAFGDSRLHALARKFGAVSLLEKPLEMASLVRIVRRTLERTDREAPLA